MAIVRKRDDLHSEAQSLSFDDAMLLIDRSGMSIPPVNVFALAEYLGLSVQEEIMDDNMSGYLEFRFGQWVAGINALHHLNRRRFSLAHEIGHYLLHRTRVDRFDDEVFTRRVGSKNPMEREADRFAAGLLMPADAFRRIVESGVKTVSDLANHFGVSSQALRFRAENLGYTIS